VIEDLKKQLETIDKGNQELIGIKQEEIDKLIKQKEDFSVKINDLENQVKYLSEKLLNNVQSNQ